MSILSALPEDCWRYTIKRARSPLNWRARVHINGGEIVKNFYARTARRAEEKAEEWIERNWPGAVHRQKYTPPA